MEYALVIHEEGSSWAGRPAVFWTFTTREETEEFLAAWVRRNWGDRSDIPEDEDEMISQYFEEAQEGYRIATRGGMNFGAPDSANRRDGNWHKCEALGNAYRVNGREVLCAPLLVNGDIDFESASELDFFRGFDGQAEVLAFLEGKGK